MFSEKILKVDLQKARGKSQDSPPIATHRHVSLANIATAFLSERKTTSRRQSSGRRKKRLTSKDKRTSDSKYQSNYSNTSSNATGQRSSMQNMEGGIATIFMANVSTNTNNKHRTNLVIKIIIFIDL
ncbi:unnamed protein product [Rotaria sp. Silwood1]|nr:unnamed protein product [Rotaria sp. Silwood1]CAF0833352.1 unnamed protein product [Rotaria sp. Silwood1]